MTAKPPSSTDVAVADEGVTGRHPSSAPRAMSNRPMSEGIHYSVSEARKASAQLLDPYHRELMEWLCSVVERLGTELATARQERDAAHVRNFEEQDEHSHLQAQLVKRAEAAERKRDDHLAELELVRQGAGARIKELEQERDKAQLSIRPHDSPDTIP